MSGNPLYSTKEWRAVRAYVLERDGHLCQIQGPGCTTQATEGDHRVPLHQGGAPLDTSNIRAACKHCNASKGASEGNRLREPHSTGWG